MKLTFLLLMVSLLQVRAATYAQQISLRENNVSLRKVLNDIHKQTGYDFIFDHDILKDIQNVTIHVKNAAIGDVLSLCFKDKPLKFHIVERSIVIEYDPVTPVIVQDIIIKGRVTDLNGTPLQGVTVSFKGGQVNSVTDGNGEYAISVPGRSGTLIFSYVGYESKEVKINDQSNISIRLAVKNNALSEVVIVSYGVQSRANVTGAISQLSASKVKDQPVGQFAQQLQGQFAGVQANINTGKPGQGMEIQIRGAVSINAGNYPLVVIDGQPLSPIGNQNPINYINPNEIESFTILKDASASALYGSRAASGVILITTKQARAGKTQISYDGYYAQASLDRSHVPPMMNAHQLATFMNQFFQDKIKYEGYINPQTGTATVPAEYANPDQYGKGTDWLGQVTRSAPTQSHNISISDYRERSSTSIVAGYFKQQGIVINTGYERYSIRANTEFRPVDGLKLGFNLAPSYTLDNNSIGSPTDGSRQIVMGALLSSPITKPYNSDGTPVNQASGFFLLALPNYRLIAENQNNKVRTGRMLGNSYLQVDLIKGLTFKTSFNIDMAQAATNAFTNQIAAAGFNAPPPRPVSAISGYYNTDNYISWVNENVLTYKKTIARDHHLEALAGYSAQKLSEYTNRSNGVTYSDASIPYVSAATTTTGTSALTQWALLSSFGRLDYNYKEKYLFETSIRSDGSSKFGSNKQYGVFPTVSAGWVASKEPFIQRMLPSISFLKIRGSYGLTGNNNFNSVNYPAASLIGNTTYVLNGALVSGRTVSQLGNADLTWEKNKQLDIGFDIGLFNNRISLTYDYYNKITDGLLYGINLPASSGFGSVNSNIGTFKFWGHEFTLSTANMTGAFKWNTSFNITFNRNLIQKLGTQNLPILPLNAYSWPNIQKVGQPVGAFYGYVNEGVYMTTADFNASPKDVTSTVGSVKMKDLTKDGKITSDDRTIIGNPNPKFIYGMTNSFACKRWDMNIVIAGSYGGQIADPLLGGDGNNLDGAFNIYASNLHHWRSESDPGDGKTPRTLAGTTALYRTFNTHSVHPGSYLTCKNITIGYNVPLHSNRYISKLRAYVSAQQAFVITKYQGLSPETNNQGTSGITGLVVGVDAVQYPIPRTISFGLNMGLF
ncbi:TonB-dependent receptor [Flavitalea sp. BT771]|uniref:TonB-dependent receptor n=1 Tax=Flavitalea sp. BT771 TaxID=3063329 RepID=UPI0026E3AC05|nr:TonB-dependent receptor [Flavitalea sp. BT771]MDO6429598.1 TonB-dependent receptor [Flavitalea sp. BT771]MDV6218274.1 TonB-dependent receptor [Flavitalea sp. BT771]